MSAGTIAQNTVIEALDYNTVVGASTKVRNVWAVGNQNTGYGQTNYTTANVSIGDLITAAQWNNAISATSNAASHQGSSIITVSAVSVGGVITASGTGGLANMAPNMTTIYSNRLNAVSQGSTSANTATYGSTWLNAVTFTHTVTFASGDAARYFFNAGGQLAITCSHPAGTGIDLLLNNLASNVGTVVMSSPTSGAVTIAGTSYNGITKVGGGGSTPTIGTNVGYFALTTTNAAAFNQTASTGPAGYLSTLINVQVKSNGTQGSNGDAGSVITIYTLWDEIPNGLSVSAGTATTVTLRPPETTYLGNIWGAITLSGTSAGS
jgi:hypothetical protein